jgi:hypothetical protein
MRRAAILLGVPAILAALVAIPLGLVRGPQHWLCAAVAVALTGTPGIVTLVAADRMAKASPYGRVAALVLGTVVRLAVGFGGAVAVFFASGDTFRSTPLVFWGWILGMYLVTLIVETVLLGRGQGSGVRRQESGDSGQQ